MMRYYILLCGILMMQIGSLSAKNKERIQTDNVTIVRNGDKVDVSFRVTVADVSKNDVLILTPVLYGKENKEIKLPDFSYLSRRAEIMAWRETRKQSFPVIGKAGHEATYSYSLPYEKWMDGANLRLEGVSKGCCRTNMLQPTLLSQRVKLATPAELFTPTMVATEPVVPVAEKLAVENKFLEPWTGSIGDKEKIIRERDGAVLVVYFPVGNSVVIPEYKNNKQELNRVLEVLDKIAASKDSRVAKILVMGSASPDGSVKLNERIAGERAQVLKDYITARTKLNASNFEIYNAGEAWDDLRRMVAGSDMQGKVQVLDIIDNTPVWDDTKQIGRMGKLQALQGGKPYQHMKETLFPLLRNAGYIKIYYESQPDPTALALNAAIEAVNKKEYVKALELLQGNDSPKADNLRGVCYMMTGKTEQAHTAFQRASQAGDEEAKVNLGLLEQIMKR